LKGSWRRDAACLLLLAALCAAFFHPLWGFQKTWYSLDFFSYYLPVLHFLHQKYAAGLAPSWNQLNLFGFPFLDEGTSGFYYPPMRLVLAHFDAIPALALLTVGHVYFAGCGAYVYCRLNGLGAGPALLAACVMSFGGGMTYGAFSLCVCVTLAWVPWQFVGSSLCLRESPRERRAGAALLGLAVGMAATGGHMMVTLCGLFSQVPWLLYECRGRWRAAWPRLLKAGLLAAPLAGLLCFGQLRATFRLSQQSERSDSYSYEYAAAGSVSPAALIHPLLPWAYGHVNDNSYLGSVWALGTDDHESLLLFVGSLALLLAGMAWAGGDKRARGLGWALGFLVLYALGKWTPLHGWLFHIPPFSHFRGPTRAALISIFPLGVSAACGLEGLLQGKLNPRRWTQAAFALAALFCLSFLALKAGQGKIMALAHPKIEARAAATASGHDVAYYEQKLARWQARLRRNLAEQALLFSLSAALLLALARLKGREFPGALLAALFVFAELFYYGSGYFPVIRGGLAGSPPQSVAWIKAREGDAKDFRVFGWGWIDMYMRAYPRGFDVAGQEGEFILREPLTNAANLLWDVPSARGYPGLPLKRNLLYFSGLWDFVPGKDFEDATARLLRRRRLLDIASVRYLISSRELSLPGLKRLEGGIATLYLNQKAMPLAWLADRVSVAAAPQEAVEKAALSRGREVVLESGRARRLDGRGTLRFLEQSDERWRLHVENQAEGLLFLSRSYYPGLWKTSVDGREAALLPADGPFCALWLGPGRHDVLLEIDDPILERGGRLYAAGWILLGLILISFLF
jgi:hypothetical protein